jgi:hypothetical protein
VASSTGKPAGAHTCMTPSVWGGKAGPREQISSLRRYSTPWPPSAYGLAGEGLIVMTVIALTVLFSEDRLKNI